MQWTSVLAIYFLFFVFSAFILLPFGVRTHDEAGLEMVPGQADSAPFAKTTLDQWNAMLAVNLTGVFLTFREGLRQFDGWGRLLAISSTAGLKGYAKVAPYAAAKHGVMGIVRSLAL